MKSEEFVSLEEVRKLLRRVERSEKRGADFLEKRIVTSTIFQVSTQLSDLAVFSFEPTLSKLVKLKK